MRTIVWFRKDLRTTDHEPLADAARRGEVIPLYVAEPTYFASAIAPHRVQFIADALGELDDALGALGSGLVVVDGPAVEVLPRLVRRWRADRVVAHRRSEPGGRAVDERLAGVLGAPLELFEGETLVPPGSLRTREGKPFSVFSAFARAHGALGAAAPPLPPPTRLPALPAGISGRELPSVAANPGVLPGGERHGHRRLEAFLDQVVDRYRDHRDRLDLDATSRLSADLKHGTLSVRTVWDSLEPTGGPGDEGRRALRRQLVWREFAYALMWDRPELAHRPFRDRWRRFPWVDDERSWRAWAGGTTGYPVIDASMRQLHAEGWVPNRARMLAASFLTKHLLVDYRQGERHYLEWLTDGDQAVNNLGWQWSAGCGVDAQPWFRVFNPVTQGLRHDPDGTWVRRWVRELAAMPTPHLHRPWAAPAEVLRAGGVVLGETYPRPIVDHAQARDRFLTAARSL